MTASASCETAICRRTIQELLGHSDVKTTMVLLWPPTHKIPDSPHDAGRKRSPAGLARLVAQETIDPFLAVSLLPAPNGRTANAGLIGNLQNRQALGRKENDQRPLHMFERPTTIAGDGEQTLAILS